MMPTAFKIVVLKSYELSHIKADTKWEFHDSITIRGRESRKAGFGVTAEEIMRHIKALYGWMRR